MTEWFGTGIFEAGLFGLALAIAARDRGPRRLPESDCAPERSGRCAAHDALRRETMRDRLGLGKSRLPAAQAALVCIGVSVIGWRLSQWPILGLEAGAPNLAMQRALLSDSPLLWVLVFWVGPAFLEELLFRGALLRALAGWAGAAVAILISSLAFAGLHAGPGTQGFAFLMGTGLGFIALRADSIWETTGIHAIYNGLVLLPLFWGSAALP